MKNILIIGGILDAATHTYFTSPSLDHLFDISDSTLRLLHIYKQLKSSYNVYLAFNEKTFDDVIDDPNILVFDHINDSLYKIKDIDLVICNIFNFEIYQDIMLLDIPVILDYGNSWGVQYKSDSLAYKKGIQEHSSVLLPLVLSKASAILYTNPNQRIIILYEISKKMINNSINGKKLIFVGFGVTGIDEFNRKDDVQNCIFADQESSESNIEILTKALSNLNIKFSYNNTNEIYRETLGCNLYNFNSFSSLVYYPFKTLEFASYGHKIIVDESLGRLFNFYRSLVYICNSSNINKLMKNLEYAKNTPIDNNILEQFRDRYSWSNQIHGLKKYIDELNMRTVSIKNKIIVKKITKSSTGEHNSHGQKVPS